MELALTVERCSRYQDLNDESLIYGGPDKSGEGGGVGGGEGGLSGT